MQTLLITGSNGVLGTKLIQASLGSFTVIATDVQPDCLNQYLGDFVYESMDVTDDRQVSAVFQKYVPSLVIHAGAWTDVDGAEKNRDLCARVNVLGTENIAKAAQGRLVHISTDYVFDGTAGPYREDDAVHPLGWYGETKYQGEQAVLGLSPHALICRTSTLYGFAPHISKFNFVGWLLRQLEQGQIVKVASDQYVNHTVAEDLASTVLRLVDQGQEGIYHTAGEDRLSRYEFAMQAANYFGFDQALIHPVTCAELGWTALRPLQGGLVMDRLHHFSKMMHTPEQLETIKKTFPWKVA